MMLLFRGVLMRSGEKGLHLKTILIDEKLLLIIAVVAHASIRVPYPIGG